MYKSDNIKQAVSLIWNSKVEEADAILSPQKQEDPRCALHYAENLWLWAFLTDNKEIQEQAKGRLREAKKIAEINAKKVAKLKGKDASVINQQLDSMIIQGEAILLNAFHQMSASHDFTKACLGLSSSWNIFQDCEKLANSSSEVDPDLLLLLHFDLGLFLFFLSFLPEFLGPASKLLSLLGFRGDRERGSKYLWEVARSNSIRAGFAYSILIAKLLFLPDNRFPISESKGDLEIGSEALDEALAKYPDGLSFLSLKGLALRRQGKHQASIPIFEDVCQRYQHLKADDSLPRLNVGNCYFNLMEWDKALEYFNTVESCKDYIRYYQAVFFKGVCLLMKGQIDEAHETIAASNRIAKSSGDNEFKEFSERGVNNAYAAFFQTLVDRNEFIWESSELYEQVQQKLNEFSDVLGINSTDRGETAYTKKHKHTRKQKEANAILFHVLQARVLLKQNNPQEALSHYSKIDSIKPSGTLEKNLYWQAMFEYADLCHTQGKSDEVLTILRKIAKDANSTRIKLSAKTALQAVA